MPGRTFQFGVFEVNERSRELRKHGVRIRVQEQPFQILLLLLERPGEIVRREEIRGKLWPDNTFVDFDSAISNAVRKLREALSDSADNPRFIETLARRGYRFIGQIAVESPPAPKPKPERTKAIVIPAAALLIVVTAAWWLRSRYQPNPVQPIPLPLTAAQGWEGFPSFSPDGNSVAYDWIEPGNVDLRHIFVKMVGSGTAVQLTSSARPDSYPAWSPDGRSIAFLRFTDQARWIFSLYVIPATGGPERKITDTYCGCAISWSPDSRFLAVADRNSPNDFVSLYLVSAESGARRRLLIPPNATTADRDGVFSPDGRALLFTRCRERFTCGLYWLDLPAGYWPRGAPRQLTPENGRILGAAWTTDGSAAVYALSGEADFNYHLMKIRIGAAGAIPERLPYIAEQVYRPSIPAHGNRLAYSQDFFDADIWEIQPGKPPRPFASSTRLDFLPQYSPDGSRIAFCSDRSGQMEIWTSDHDGRNPAPLTNSSEHSCSPQWSPDGHWIAFDRHMKDTWHIFLMAADGGQEHQLTSDDTGEMVPNWSRDGRWLYFASNRTGRFEIWKMPSAGGERMQVTHNGGWTAFESFDGRSLYYTKNLNNHDDYSGLWVLPLNTAGEERRILDSIPSRSFTVTQDGIYYIPTPAEDGSTSLRFRNFATGTDQPIAPIKRDFFGGLTVSPDRQTILFSMATRTGSNVMIVDNFR